jgi:hypothetical protein
MKICGMTCAANQDFSSAHAVGQSVNRRTRIALVVIRAGVVLRRQKPIVHFARDLDAK